MKNQRDVLKEVLRRFRFDAPIPEETKKRIIMSRKKTLTTILKLQGASSVFLAAAVMLYMNLKKWGISFSLNQCLIAVYAGIASIVIALSAGSAFVVKDIITGYMKPESINELTIREKKDSDKATIEQAEENNRSLSSIQFAMVMPPFSYDKMSKKKGIIIESVLFDELEAIVGSNKIKRIATVKSDRNVQRILTGSVVMLDAKYLVTVRMLDRNTSRILALFSETARSEKELNNACSVLARKIADRL